MGMFRSRPFLLIVALMNSSASSKSMSSQVSSMVSPTRSPVKRRIVKSLALPPRGLRDAAIHLLPRWRPHPARLSALHVNLAGAWNLLRPSVGVLSPEPHELSHLHDRPGGVGLPLPSMEPIPRILKP